MPPGTDFLPVDLLDYNSDMERLVLTTSTTNQPAALRYLSVAAGSGAQPEIFFSGRDVRGMDFIIGNPATVSIDDEGALAALPRQVSLMQNYPNPFNPTTSIRFELPESSEVCLAVYDLAGRLVQVLEQGHRAAGVYTVSFDAASLASGVYLYRLETPGFSQTLKMTLIK
jgi:hypothetical protein